MSLLLFAGFGLKCYECNSHNDSRCAQDTPPDELSVTCDHQKTICRKVTQEIDYSIDGKCIIRLWFILRNDKIMFMRYFKSSRCWSSCHPDVWHWGCPRGNGSLLHPVRIRRPSSRLLLQQWRQLQWIHIALGHCLDRCSTAGHCWIHGRRSSIDAHHIANIYNTLTHTRIHHPTHIH